MAANRFDQLIDEWEPRVKKAFLDSIYNLRDQAQIENIAHMLERGDVDGALRAVGLDPASMRPLDKTVHDTFEAGGKFTAQGIPDGKTSDGLRIKYQFNIRNPLAEQWLRDRSSNLIVAIMDDQRNMVRQFLQANLAAGNNPRSAALDLIGRISASGRREGGIIGLTASQEEWVRNYAADLRSENPLDALRRNLRDARFDAAVRRYVMNGEKIPADLIDKMVTAYKNRALRFRAEAIGRTETMASLHTSQQMSIEQAIEIGAIKPEDVSFIWRTARDHRVRDSHAVMDGEEVKFGESFVTGNGNLLEYPGDPNGAPEEIINCRCWREPQVDFFAGLK